MENPVQPESKAAQSTGGLLSNGGPAVDLSREALNFLRDFISSAEMLDVLVVLHRNVHRDLTVEEVAGAAFTVPSAAQMRLDELMDRDLARRIEGEPPRFRLAALNPVRNLILQEINDAYARNRVAVAKIIFSRADALDAFASAFRLRKEP